jgi:murein DD-endopeptidase MepM/ murein hydrolase activator NlpD
MMLKKWQHDEAKWKMRGLVFGCLVLSFVFFVKWSREISAASEPKIASQTASAKVSSGVTEDLQELRERNLLFPLQGFTAQGITDSFNESRGNHLHEAIDIVAPRNTPIVAVEDGEIARLWYSKNGGITIYQFDPSETYVYYYAHLQRYADNLKEKDHVKRGEIIGYVGTSGNAPKHTPHLHFTIFKLTAEKHWWEGSPINPYDIYSAFQES